MQSKHVLVISAYALFVEAIVQVLQNEGIEVIATANSLEAALPVLQQHQPDTIIIDSEEGCVPCSKVISLLQGSAEDRQVIFLTLSSNQMVVHQRHVGTATPADLISLLGSKPLADGLTNAQK